MTKKSFERAAHPSSNWQKEGKPDPEKVAERGIKTRESLDWMAAQEPDKPEPAYKIDNADVREASDAGARAKNRQRVTWLRERFHQKSRKARADFATARDFRRDDRER
ncbi:hypothetical protein [Ruegeria arenilitoris]|uniref:hypothetical protein n=1 Tax=Ruegeria arenilitoris TaxID=1173585 RepID=UPI0014808CBA|nr:hypothetical protein [Ruegeria arenilitoris]